MGSLAKLAAPKLANAIARTSLFQLLEQRQTASIIWIEGPSGAGKTTLAASYLAARQIPALWYQVDKDDADPGSFFYFLSRALDDLQPGAGAAAPAMTAGDAADPAAFARRYFRYLFDAVGGKFALVFDNFERLPESAPHWSFLRDIAEERPPEAAMFVLSRSAPPASLSRARLHESLFVLDWKALRLTDAEIEAIALSHPNGRAWTPFALNNLSDGWAAGVRLLLDHGGPNREGELSTTSRQALFDHLAGEVFDELTLAEQTILLRTAMLPTVSEEHAAVLSGDSRAGATLEDFCRRNLFTYHRGGASNIYQYHSLLKEFLLDRLVRTVTPQERTLLAHRSARLLANTDEDGAAVDLFLEADDSDSAAALLIRRAADLVSQHRTIALRQWIDSLPPSLLAKNAELTFWKGVCFDRVDPQTARELYARAADLFAQVGDSTNRMRALAAIVSSIHSQMGDFSGAENWIGALEAAALEGRAFSDLNTEAFAFSSLILAKFNRAGVDAGFPILTARAKALLKTAPDVNARVSVANALLTYYVAAGAGREVRRLLPLFLNELDDRAVQPGLFCVHAVTVAWAQQLFLGQFGSAVDIMQRAVALAHENKLSGFAPVLLMARAMVYLQAGEAALARQDVIAATQLAPPGVTLAPYDWVMAGILVLEGASEAAVEHGVKGMKSAKDGGFSEMGAAYYACFAYCAAGRFEHALDVARSSRERFAALCGIGGTLDCALPEVYALLKLSRHDEAEPLLRDLLDLWARETIHGPALPLQSVLSYVFAFALDRGIQREYVKSLIKKHNLPPVSPDAEAWPRKAEIRVLGALSICSNGEPLPTTRKAPKAQHALLVALIALGGRDVPEHKVCDELWHDKDGDVAHALLATGLHRLRKLLGDARAIQLSGGRITFDTSLLWVDALSFERTAHQALAGNCDAATAIHLYRGPFAPAYYGAAVQTARSRLAATYRQLVVREATRLETAGDSASAVAILERAIEVDPSDLVFYDSLIRHFSRMDRHHEARAVRSRRDAIAGGD